MTRSRTKEMSKQHSKEYMEQFGMQNVQIRWCTITEVLPKHVLCYSSWRRKRMAFRDGSSSVCVTL